MSYEEEMNAPVAQPAIVDALPEYYGLAGHAGDALAMRRAVVAAVHHGRVELMGVDDVDDPIEHVPQDPHRVHADGEHVRDRHR